MANHAITKFNTPPNSVEVVSAAMETYIETVDTTKTLLLYTMVPQGSGNVVGVIHHST